MLLIFERTNEKSSTSKRSLDIVASNGNLSYDNNNRRGCKTNGMKNMLSRISKIYVPNDIHGPFFFDIFPEKLCATINHPAIKYSHG